MFFNASLNTIFYCNIKIRLAVIDTGGWKTADDVLDALFGLDYTLQSCVYLYMQLAGTDAYLWSAFFCNCLERIPVLYLFAQLARTDAYLWCAFSGNCLEWMPTRAVSSSATGWNGCLPVVYPFLQLAGIYAHLCCTFSCNW